MKKYEEEKNTGSRSVFRKLMCNRLLSCGYCPPNKGCNRKRSQGRGWKEHRRTQWKVNEAV